MDNCLPIDTPAIKVLIDQINWELFWKKVDLADDIFDCQAWTGSKDSSGYGTFWVSGRTLSSHRIGFLDIHKTLPIKGYELHHECLNRACVNGRHHSVVTHEENMNLSRTTLDRLPSSLTRFKEKCKNGHLMIEDNTYVDRRGWSECRSCRQENVRRWRQKREGVMP